jgi:CRISP-associated protein Cas1
MDVNFPTRNSGGHYPELVVASELIQPGHLNKANDSAQCGDDAEWAERSAYWQQQNAWRPRHPHQKRKHRNPLVLGGHGVRLRIDRGSLFVQNGFTHYPQLREEWRFFPGHPDLPSRIVVLDADGSITFDVLAWLSAQGVPLIQINWRGEAIVVGAASGYAANIELVQAQRAAQASKRRTMAISRWLVAEKITASCDTLTQAMAVSPSRERALQELAASAREMKSRPPQTMDALRGIEGRAAQAYLMAWRAMPVRWKGLGRMPIPEEWQRIGPRTPPNSKRNRNATHPVNAMLNYGYAVLVTSSKPVATSPPSARSTRPTANSTTRRRTSRRNSATGIASLAPEDVASRSTIGCLLYASSAGPVAAHRKSGPLIPASQKRCICSVMLARIEASTKRS